MQGMVRQPFHLLSQAIRGESFDGFNDPCVQPPPSFLEQTAVSHLMGQGVFEGEFALREQPRLVEELSRLQAGEAAVQGRLGPLGHGLQ